MSEEVIYDFIVVIVHSDERAETVRLLPGDISPCLRSLPVSISSLQKAEFMALLL